MNTCVYAAFEPSAAALPFLSEAQRAAESGDLQESVLALSKGAAIGDSQCMYNLACMLCNPGSVQNIQDGAATYLFLFKRNKSFPEQAAIILANAVENFAMMLRLSHIPCPAELPLEPMSTLRGVAKAARDCKKAKKDVKLRATVDAISVIVHFTCGWVSWDSARKLVCSGAAFSSDNVQGLRKHALSQYRKALDAGEHLPTKVGQPLLDMTLGYVHDHLATIRGNIEELTNDKLNHCYQGRFLPSGDFVGLGPDGELRFIPADETKPFLVGGPNDREGFFTGLVQGPLPMLSEPACAVCHSRRSLSKCSGCASVYYCCPEHQKAHWQEHKASCKTAQLPNSIGLPSPQTPSPDRATCETFSRTVVVGCCVQLSGLSKALELVGQRGRVEHLDTGSKRWQVKLESGRVVKVLASNLVVVPRLFSDDAAEAGMQRQEAEFYHCASCLLEKVRPSYSERRNPATGNNFVEEFLQIWHKLCEDERRNFLQSVLVHTLEQQSAPAPQIASAYAAAELTNNEILVTQPDALGNYLEHCVNGDAIEDVFLQRLALGSVGFAVEELKDHPHKLEYELRLVQSYAPYFRARVAFSIVTLGMALLGNVDANG